MGVAGGCWSGLAGQRTAPPQRPQSPSTPRMCSAMLRSRAGATRSRGEWVRRFRGVHSSPRGNRGSARTAGSRCAGRVHRDRLPLCSALRSPRPHPPGLVRLRRPPRGCSSCVDRGRPTRLRERPHPLRAVRLQRRRGRRAPSCLPAARRSSTVRFGIRRGGALEHCRSILGHSSRRGARRRTEASAGLRTRSPRGGRGTRASSRAQGEREVERLGSEGGRGVEVAHPERHGAGREPLRLERVD